MLYLGVLLLLVLQYLRPQEFPSVLRGVPLVFYTMAILLPIWLVTLTRKKLLRTPEDIFAALFYVICILSYWNYWKSHMYSVALNFGKIMLCYIFVAHVIETRRQLAGAVWMTMLMLLIVCSVAGPNVGLPNQYASIGLFDNRNDFAYAMAIMLAFAAAFVLRGDPFSKIVGLGTLVLGTIKVILSDSRGGQFACIIGICAVFYMLAKSKRTRKVMFIAGVVVVLLAVSLNQRLGSAADYKQDKSAMGRVWMWARALDLFKEYPVLGIGFQTWEERPKTERDTHNSYMRAIAEIGGAGLFIYLGLMMYALRDAMRVARTAHAPTLRVVALGLTGALVGQIVGGFFQTRTYHLICLILIAFASSLRLIAQREEGLTLEPAPDGLGSGDLSSARNSAGNQLAPAPRGSASRPRALPPGPGGVTAMGLYVRGLILRKDLVRIGLLTAGCWLAHKLFVVFG